MKGGASSSTNDPLEYQEVEAISRNATGTPLIASLSPALSIALALAGVLEMTLKEGGVQHQVLLYLRGLCIIGCR